MIEHPSPASQHEERITCSVYRHRTLARANNEGLLLWCRSCKRQHRISWAALAQVQREFDDGLVSAVDVKCDTKIAEA
ncbi:MAG TPA: hypothetical protein VNE38_06110 [Ktedonobacteraceae bacterium]|nr:hypothetical protein [Ktedonobacteraceae bacterium]